MSEKFVALKFKSNILPATIFRCEELNMVWFTSNSRLERERYVNTTHYSIVLISGFVDKLTKSFITKRIVDLIRFLSFILPDYISVNWLKDNSYTLDLERLELHPIQRLDSYISKNKIQSIRDANCIYKIDLNSFTYPFNSLVEGIDFKELLIHFSNLAEKDNLRSQIELFSLIGVLPVLTGPFYDNDNLEKSLMFSLAEKIIDESIKEHEIVKKCESCGKETPGKKGIRRKISEFVDSFDSSTQNKEILKKALIQLGEIRHPFFHGVKKSILIEELDDLQEKMKEMNPNFDGYVNIKDALKYKFPRGSAFLLLRNVLQKELIHKLERTDANNKTV